MQSLAEWVLSILANPFAETAVSMVITVWLVNLVVNKFKRTYLHRHNGRPGKEIY